MEDIAESKGDENDSPSATPSSNVEENKSACDRDSNSPEGAQNVFPQNFEVRDVSKTHMEHENRHFVVASHAVEDDDDEEEEEGEHTHINENYQNIAEEVYNSEEFITAADIREDESVFACKYPQCNFRTLDADVFLKHEDLHVDGKSYECDVCHMKFTLFSNMRRHKLSHFGGRPFECRLCTKRFFRKEHLMEHVVRQHSKQRPYRCPFCIKSFNSRPHLKSHLSSDHSAVVQDRVCRLCGYKSSSTNNAQVHFTLCHMKQSHEISDISRSNHGYITIAQNHQAVPENEAVDLGSISQNFSFIPPHYSAFAYASTESSLAGPSEPSNLITRLTQTPVPCALTSEITRESRVLEPMDQVDPSPVSSLASSTTTGNPALCRNGTPNGNTGENTDSTNLTRIAIKPEPPEVVIEDSQNSNVQPTSTMDLTINIVETTCGANEIPVHHPCSSNYVQSGKIKNSSGDEAGSERPHSPSTGRNDGSHDNLCWSTDNPCSSATKSKCRSRCKESKYKHQSSAYPSQSRLSQSDRSTKRHRTQGDNTRSKSTRMSSDNLDSFAPERKVFPLHENVPVSSRDVHLSEEISQHQTPISHQHSSDIPHTSKVEIEDSFTIDDKSMLALNRIEQNTLMCPYCGIVFPDQTLYFLHRSLHTETSPWKCNLCGRHCKDKYDFNSHIISKGHH